MTSGAADAVERRSLTACPARAVGTGGFGILLLGAWLGAPTSVRGQEAADPEIGEPPDAEELARVVERVERLDAMRSGLAGTFGARGEEPDRETFQRVCRPVGMEAKRIAEANGWRVAQLAAKFRNPAHRPDPEARRVLDRMEDDRDLRGLWKRSVVEGEEGWRYFRRIVVEPACLACHGAEEERPTFVKEAYPRDRAFGFRVGDLRGLYSVFVPATPEAAGSGVRSEPAGSEPRTRRAGER